MQASTASDALSANSRRAAIVVFVGAQALTYVPFYGLPLSVGVVLVVLIVRRQLWGSGVARGRAMLCALLAWLGLWWPGLTYFLTGWSLVQSSEISTSWLIIPLCGPVGAGTVVVPALAAPWWPGSA